MVVTAITWSGSVAWRIPRKNPTARMESKVTMYSTSVAESARLPISWSRPSARAGAELVYRYAVELLPGFQLSRGKAGLVRRVREMLGFQTKCKSPVVDAPLLSGDRSVEEVSGVELQSRF